FLGFAIPVNSVEEAKVELDLLKKEYFDARHHCFAYCINPEDPQIRANDDGEPNNSAGMPIFNQLQSAEVWNALVVVIRYFGGTKLGVSGLINAYKNAAGMALEASQKRTEYIMENLKIRFPYKLTNTIMRLIKDEGVIIISEDMHTDAGYTLGVRKSKTQQVLEQINGYHEVVIL
ncbi:MAG: IMPACT family protein, partial [Owenweeksia sp.]